MLALNHKVFFSTEHAESHGEALRAIAIAGTNLVRPVIPKNSVASVILRMLRAEILIFAGPIADPSILDSRSCSLEITRIFAWIRNLPADSAPFSSGTFESLRRLASNEANQRDNRANRTCHAQCSRHANPLR